MTKKQILATLIVAVGAVFLWKNYTPSPDSKLPTVQGAVPASQSTGIDPAPTRAVAAAAPQPVPVAPRSNTTVIAPAINGSLAGRFKTGPNAQNNWAPNSGQLKTGPNAQTDLDPKRSNLKTGPNAQTDLTMKRSW